jgi:hypothetical protein
LSRTRVKGIQKLLPTQGIGIANKSVRAGERFEKGLPIISCECGDKILVVPDLQAMNNAIKTHVAKHKKNKILRTKYSHPGKINHLLSQLTLLRISEQNNT